MPDSVPSPDSQPALQCHLQVLLCLQVRTSLPAAALLPQLLSAFTAHVSEQHCQHGAQLQLRMNDRQTILHTDIALTLAAAAFFLWSEGMPQQGRTTIRLVTSTAAAAALARLQMLPARPSVLILSQC